MGFSLNLTGEDIKKAQGGGFPVLPEATYGAVIYANTQKMSKSKNKPMFEIDYKIIEGPAGQNRRQRAWYSLTPEALFKLVELNKAVGFPYPDKDTPAGAFELPDADEYVNIKVNIVLGKEKFPSVDEKGNQFDEHGEQVYGERNVVKKVLEYDPDSITTEDELEEDSDDESGFTL